VWAGNRGRQIGCGRSGTRRDPTGVIATEALPGQQPCTLAFGSRAGTEVSGDDGELGCSRPYLHGAPGQVPGPGERLAGAIR